jgi:hypothetical protein
MKTSAADMRALMEPTGLKFRIDDDGDAVCNIGGLGPDKDRTQIVFVRADVHEWDQYKDRDVFSHIAPLASLPRNFDILLKLLEITAQKKGGALIASSSHLIYRFDVPVTASTDHLRDAVYLCGDIADELERALVTGDKF